MVQQIHHKMEFILDPSLVVYLPLYETDGAAIRSRDAYGHSGTAAGGVWRPSGRYFDGVDDYLNLGDIDALDGLKMITVEAWCNPGVGALAVGGRAVAKNSVFGFGGGYSAGKANFVINDGSWRSSGHGITSLNDGSWWHLVGTYDGSEVRVFVNAIQESSGSFASLTMQSSANPVVVGALTTIPNELWPGVIGEVRIYNRALTPLEIQHNYLATKWRYR